MPCPTQSEEDIALKASLDAAVATVGGADDAATADALALMAKEIKTATSTMTSVPKPLKFLNPHFDALVTKYEVRHPPLCRREPCEGPPALGVAPRRLTRVP